MIVVYTPEDGGEPQHYDASTLRTSEATILQRTVDMKWQQIVESLGRDDLDAMRGIVWIIKKRTAPTMRFGDFDPLVTELTSKMSNKEISDFLEALFAEGVANEELTTGQVAEILRARVDEAAVDPAFARQLVDRLEAEAEADPKGSADLESLAEATSSSPTPTSSTPETPTSRCSPTSSTSPQPESTTSPPSTSTP